MGGETTGRAAPPPPVYPAFQLQQSFTIHFALLPMDLDHLAEERAEILFAAWLKALVGNNPEQYAASLAVRHHEGAPATAKLLANGAFSVCYRVTFENGDRVVVRFTAIGRVLARHEKVEDEVAVMRYLAQHSQIPVPKVFGLGTCMYGPYIVMEYVKGNMLSGYMRDPSKRHLSLRPGLHPRVLRKAYEAMADILLDMSKLEFPRIGAIVQSADGDFVVQKRPFTFNMNRISQFCNISLSIFENSTFDNAGDYFEELARYHMEQPRRQQNDAIEDEADCRKKYVARALFRRLACTLCDEQCKGPFRLFCEDLSPNNVIVDENRLAVAGVVDWEFTYAAPVEFTYAAPWWLLLEQPESRDEDLTEFLGRFMPKFRVFVEALKDCETAKIDGGTLLESGRLSTIMEQSVDSGLFWVCLALRRSTMLDEVYWTFIDPKFHGPFDTIEQRIDLLDAEEKAEMESLVQKKMRQAEEQALDENYTVEEIMAL